MSASSVVQTTEGAEGEGDKLAQWLDEHNLNKAKAKIIDWGISLDELTELSSKSLQDLELNYTIYNYFYSVH